MISVGYFLKHYLTKTDCAKLTHPLQLLQLSQLRQLLQISRLFQLPQLSRR
jgi:hypothetical protein